jgi:TatD DNase family protein
MAPAMFPGQRNSPAHLPAICSALAQIMAISPEQLASASTANACELFNW